jgi:hypothetical protein
MANTDHDSVEELEDEQAFFPVKNNALTRALDGAWLENGSIHASNLAQSQGASMLANARALVPELERRRASYEDALIDLRRLGAANLFGAWRIGGRTYIALIAAAGALMTAGAYASLAPLRAGWMSFFSSVGFALNVTGLAHLAGGWGRRIQGLNSWLRRGATALTAAGACAEIAALIYVFGLGWTDVSALRLAAILAGALLAVIASALRTHPNPDAPRLLRRRAEAQRDYETVRQQIAAEILTERQAFETEASLLQQAARPLPRRIDGPEALS